MAEAIAPEENATPRPPIQPEYLRLDLPFVDDRPHWEKRSERRRAQSDVLQNGALADAEERCQQKSEEERRACVDEQLKKALEEAFRDAQTALSELEVMAAAIERCESLTDAAEKERCKTSLEANAKSRIDEMDRLKAETEAARLEEALSTAFELYGCADGFDGVPGACRAVHVLRHPGDISTPPARWIGSGIVRTFDGHLHRHLVAVSLRHDADALEICAIFVRPDTTEEQRQIREAVLALLDGDPRIDNPAMRWASEYNFQENQCVEASTDSTGRIISRDRKWSLSISGGIAAFHGRAWGPQLADLVADLGDPIRGQ